MNKQEIKIAFFGSPDIAVWVLTELEKGSVVPSLIITNPDAPQGRNMVLTPTPVSDWADTRHIHTLKPKKLNDVEFETALKNSGCNLFIAAAYGKFIPKHILDIPQFKTLNVHPSLLPKLRGASPIRTAILEDQNPTGVTIMLLTPGMDEGPILAQEEILFSKEEWPVPGSMLDKILAEKGGKLLLKILPSWILGTCAVQEQNHTEATYTKKITKDMGHIDLSDDPKSNLLKIKALEGWPRTYFFTEKNNTKIRVKVVDAEIVNDTLHIIRVIPEGKKEMSYDDFVRGL